MPNLLLTGNILTTQRYGGISRYINELAVGVLGSADWAVKIASPIYVNQYLYANRRMLNHRGVHINQYRRGMLAASELLVDLGFRHLLESADIVHETNFNFTRLKRSKSGRVSTFYDMMTEALNPRDAVREKKRLTAEYSDKVIAISESTKRDIVNYLGIAPEKIQVIHLASRVKPVRNPIPRLSATPYLLWVGARFDYKNFNRVIPALATSRRFRRNFKLVCAGGMPFSADEKRLILSHGLTEAHFLHCTPSESDLASLYSHAEMLIYPSRYEVFGLPPLEAMKCGCPVLAANTTSIPEITGDSAILVSPDDSDEMAFEIDRMLEDQTLRKDLIRKGQLRSEMFSWKRCVESHLALYDSIL